MIGPQFPPNALEAKEPFDTLGALELKSIAQGVVALDAMIKESPIRIACAQSASPGKYLILIAGEVEEVARSLATGIEVASVDHLDDLLLPRTHDELRRFLEPVDSPAASRGRVALRDLRSESSETELPALGIIETFGGPSLLGAVDTALKTAETRLVDLHLLSGIGGKATALLAGDVESVKIGVEAGASHAEARSCLAKQVVIPRPDPSLADLLTRQRAST